MTDYNFQNSVKYRIIFSQNTGIGISETPDLKNSRGEHAPGPPNEFSRLRRSQFPPQFSHADDAPGNKANL